jgi:hypothetical protein
MSRLRTVATYDMLPQAQLAQTLLQEAGIKAVIADAEMIVSNWHLSNALGGIKVQVWEEDVDRAAELLAEADTTPDIDDEELTRQALAEAAEPDTDPEAAEPEPESEPEPEPDIPPVDREKYAWRAFVVAWWGLLIPPLGFYSLYLFLNAAFGPGELSRLGRIRLAVTAVFVAVSVFVQGLMLRGLLFPPEPVINFR